MHQFIIKFKGLILCLFFTKGPSTRFSPKKSFSSIVRLYAVVVSCKKISKVPCIGFSRTWKTSFWQPFGQKVFSKIIIYANFKSLCYCNFTQKIKKFHALMCEKTFKTTFWPHFWPLLAQKRQNETFPKKFSWSIIRLHAPLCKSTNLYAVSIFHKTLKTSIWAYFCPCWPENLQLRFSSKKSFRSILKLKVAVFSCKKIRKRHESILH